MNLKQTLAMSIRRTTAIARTVYQFVASKNTDLSTSLEMTLLRGREVDPSLTLRMTMLRSWEADPLL